MELQDARVLVVGASSGIGRAVALQAAAGGARVVLAARRADKLAEAAAEAGDGASTVVCDVRQPEQCERVVRDAVAQLGGLDVAVYATAVDPLVRAWRGEHPEIAFCNVAVGNTLGTEVYQSWDPVLLGELSPVWEARGYVHDNGPGAMSVGDCATAVLAAITSPIDLRYVLANPAPGSTMDVA